MNAIPDPSLALDPAQTIQAFFALLDCAALALGPAAKHPAVMLLMWFGF